MKTSLNGEGNSHLSPRNPESLKQDKPKENMPRYILVKLMKIKHKEQILKATKKKQQITHKGIPTMITADLDLSIETLQARREWQDILKAMKEKNLQPRLLFSKDLIQICKRRQKLYRQAKAQRIQHHQTSSSTNAKRSPLGRKQRKGL